MMTSRRRCRSVTRRCNRWCGVGRSNVAVRLLTSSLNGPRSASSTSHNSSSRWWRHITWLQKNKIHCFVDNYLFCLLEKVKAQMHLNFWASIFICRLILCPWKYFWRSWNQNVYYRTGRCQQVAFLMGKTKLIFNIILIIQSEKIIPWFWCTQ